MADDFAGNHEVETSIEHIFGNRLVDHEDLAVEAGIEVRAVAVLGVQDDILVFLDDIHDVQFDPELFGDPQRVVALLPRGVLLADSMGVAFHAEPGVEVDALDFDALVKHHLGGEQGVEPARNQRGGPPRYDGAFVFRSHERYVTPSFCGVLVRALLQRVNEASVSVAGREIAAIDRGLVVFLAVFVGDDEPAARRLAERTLALRIFPDEHKPLNRSVLDIGGGILAVSQFTLAADTRRGNRPGFGPAAPPGQALELYRRYLDALRDGCPNVGAGEFGANMQVSLVNDGPVTILLDVP